MGSGKPQSSVAGLRQTAAGQELGGGDSRQDLLQRADDHESQCDATQRDCTWFPSQSNLTKLKPNFKPKIYPYIVISGYLENMY